MNGKDHVTALADRYASYAKTLRDAIDHTDELGDADTADLYTEISRAIDKRLWFLEAHLQTSIESVTEPGEISVDGKTSSAKAKKTRVKNK